MKWREFLARTSDSCFWCGWRYRPRSGNAMNIDHLKPRGRGGRHGSDNIVLSCRVCNHSRGDMMPLEWLVSVKFPLDQLGPVRTVRVIRRVLALPYFLQTFDPERVVLTSKRKRIAA